MRVVVDTNVLVSAASKTNPCQRWPCISSNDGRADLIVSGDADLLTLHPFRGIPIVTPAVFVQGMVPK